MTVINQAKFIDDLKFIIRKYDEVNERYGKTAKTEESLALMRGSMYVINDLINLLREYEIEW